ncbi:Alcohol oxidase [Mycena chlorophos]|uniref:Alcohol oxidase n=1 Tax=Mycena chlorophos TaxID=658473 RepID=A0A8H6SQS2_MYCCL|nr:Alcohol oxidase [Mycena chlorophos]
MTTLRFRPTPRATATDSQSSSVSGTRSDSVALLLPLVALLLFLLGFITVMLLRRFKRNKSRRHSYRRHSPRSLHKYQPAFESQTLPLLHPDWEKHDDDVLVRVPDLAYTADADNVAPGQEDAVFRTTRNQKRALFVLYKPPPPVNAPTPFHYW